MPAAILSRLFFRVETSDDARRAMAVGWRTSYAVAGLSFLLVVVLALGDGPLREPERILEPVYSMAGITLFTGLIQLRQSRAAAALVLLFWTLVGVMVATGTAGVSLQAPYGPGDWNRTNFAAAIAVAVCAMAGIYAGYQAIRGSFRHHALAGSRTIWKNAAIVFVVILAYWFGVIVLITAILMFFPDYCFLYGPASDDLDDFWFEQLLRWLHLCIVFAGLYRILPGTISRRTVIPTKAG